MKLRQWSSNSHQLLQLLPAADSTSSGTVSVLGIPWNTSTDQVSIPGSPSLQPSDVLTKRHVLSQVTTIYDPLGLINPVTFSGKVFLQEICQSHVSWDEPLPARECGEWDRLTQVLRDIPTLKLPRFQPTLYECTSYELHIFCDASCKSYAATVYLRGTRGQSIATSLVFSKMRLAPFRTRSRPHAKQRRGTQITLPRLELLGALIGVRAGAFISDQLKLPITKRTVWLDSQCVLHWLKTTKPLSVFVENRITEIRKNSNTTYCYVPTSQNPADLATRGCTIPQLKASTMWWQDPPWLQLPDNCWPKWNLPDITPTILEFVRDEVRGPKFFHETPSTVAVSTLTDGHSTPLASPLSINETRFSRLRTLLRVTAYILKFLTARLWQRLSDDTRANLRRNRKLLSTLLDRSGEPLPPSADDLRNARLLWEYTLQRRRFSDVITAIQTRRQHHLVRQLGLQLDDHALLRCHGRFEHATISPTARTPILLSRKEHYTRLVIQEIHERLFHAGTSHTLAQVRDTYWIPQGRVAVRSILTRCTLCKRYDGLPFRLPAMPPWPKERVSRSIPFQFTGLDYLGPVMVRDGQTTTKIWICLFTCLAVRAVHLEYVKDLTSRQFLDCIRRFVARRGPPERIISDNAPQFKLTKTAIDNEFRQAVISHDVLSYFATHGIKWTFITELAPWHGGFYERLVGLVKQALRKSLGRQLLSFHQMVTLITEIEAVINSRPLTFVYSDLESGFTLTPSHFLTMQHCLSLPCSPSDALDSDFKLAATSADTVVAHWRQSQRCLDAFWAIWHTEYLLSLRERLPLHHRNHRRIRSDPKIGEVVIIQEKGQPRGTWHLGRIDTVTTGSDGQVRSARVLLPSQRAITRPLNLLFPLEIPMSSNDTRSILPDPSQTANVGKATPTAPTVSNTTQRPTRSASAHARIRMKEWLREDPVAFMFTVPKSVP